MATGKSSSKKGRKPSTKTSDIRQVIEREYAYDVSVIMPLHDPDLRRVRAALESLQKQGVERLQAVMVNDGSVMELVAPVVEGLTVEVINLRENVGVVAALNQGAEAAQGEYIITLGDDTFADGALGRLLAALRGSHNPAWRFAYGDVLLATGVHVTPAWRAHRMGEHFRTSYAVMWHRSLFGQVAWYQPEEVPVYFEDLDFVLQLEAAGVEGIKVPGVVLEYQKTGGGLSERARPHEARIRDILRARWEALNE